MVPISPERFIDAAVAAGIDFFSGVPCSFLSGLIVAASTRRDALYAPATNEGEAAAICAGAWLGGRRAALLAQVSGLAEALNTLTSLHAPFAIPILLLVSARGAPDIADEPQHEVLGRNLMNLLQMVGASYHEIPEDGNLEVALANASADMDNRKRVAFIVRRGTFADFVVCNRSNAVSATRASSLRWPINFCTGGQLGLNEAIGIAINGTAQDAAIFASTGQICRHLFGWGDHDRFFYMVGSMGCASAMALGVAMSAARPTVVLDGDGALLMRMGNLTTIGSIYPRSFVHIVMDNGGYGTTGGQASSSRITDIAAVAHACNYASIFTCDTKEGLVRAVHEACDSNGPVLIRAHVTDSPLPSRPNVAPRDVAWRFSRYLASSNQQRESNEENT